MKIVIVLNEIIPAPLYGGIERVIWSLGKELVKLGHRVCFLVKKGSSCPFAEVVAIDPNKDVLDQLPKDADFVHFNTEHDGLERLDKAFLVTMHGNINDLRGLNVNTVFVSRNHAGRFGSDCFVHNGLDWTEYGKVDLSIKRDSFHFLGKASWRVKNVKAAIDIIKDIPNEKLNVLGGVRFNINMGLRITCTPKAHFYGMVGGDNKFRLLNLSKGLIFPVRWHEPFGLAIIESLYFGCPVFGTPYGSLPEIVTPDYGVLSNRKEVLTAAIEHAGRFSNGDCHAYARDHFNSRKMAVAYLEKYRRILDGEPLHLHAPRLVAIQEEKFLPWYN